jgi:signal transduction histidine kinase
MPEPADDSFRQRDRLLTYLDEQRLPIPDDLRPSQRVLRGEVLRGESAVDLVVRTHGDHEVILNASGAPIRDAAGQIVGGVLIGRDVTQRRRQEQQTREALAALVAMAEVLVSGGSGGSGGATFAEGSPSAAPDIARRLAELTRAVMGCERVGVFTFNLETELLDTLAVSGLSKEQEHKWNYTVRMNNPPEIFDALQAGEVLILDRTRPPYDSLPNPFGSSAMLLVPISVGGPILGVISVDYGSARHEFTADEHAMAGAVAKLAAQIIERDRLARDREMARANALAMAETARRMDEFLSIAAHELRTPVTNSTLTVTLAIDTLRRYAAQAEAAQDPRADTLRPILSLLERTGSHVDRLGRLVVDLLDVSRIRAGKLELRLTSCNLAAVVREVVEEQRQMAPGRDIHLQLPGLSQQPPLVLADPDRIRQVTANYLSNALKYSRGDQRISVRLHVAEPWVRVAVRDEGPGVPVAEQRHVWERFYRVPGTQVLSGTGIGLGLGLHISRTIVEQHHGRVGLRNAPGGGSVFWFALQRLDD